MSVRVTEATAKAVDEARGETSRAVWIEEAIAARLARERDSGIRERLGIGITADDRQPPGIVSVVSRGEEKTEVRSFALAPEEPAAKPCKHKGLKLSKGVCPDCKEWAVKS